MSESLFSPRTSGQSPCFVMCGKAICRIHGCLLVYEADCEMAQTCTCPEAGLDPGCQWHGSSAGGEGYV